ncbi:MAG: hypothetical protein E6Q99_05315, partial [Elusimicrobia bacterium]
MNALWILLLAGAVSGLRAEENLAGPMVSTSPYSDVEGTALEAPNEDVSIAPAPPPRSPWMT